MAAYQTKMTEAMKALASIVRGSLRAGLNVSFTKAELGIMGIKVPKSKLHLIKPDAPKEDFKVCTFKQAL